MTFGDLLTKPWTGLGILLALAAVPVPQEGEGGLSGGEEIPPVVPAQEEGDPPPDPSPPAEDVPAVPEPPAFDHLFTIEEIETAAADLVTRYPDLVRLETVGVSRGGRSIVALVVTDSTIVPAGAKPALAVVNHCGESWARGAEIGLRLAWDLASRQAENDEVARLLEEVAIYVLPAADPDVRTSSAAGDPLPPRAVRYDLNFPAGWLPESVRPGSGDYPLSEPETLASARFLDSHPDVVALLDAVPPGGGRPLSADAAPEGLPGPDLAVYRKVTAALEERVVVEPASDGRRSSILDHAGATRGIFALSLPLLPLHDATDPAALATLVQGEAGIAAALAHLLPRVAITERAVTRLGPDLWQLDVVLENRGLLPTASALARVRVPRQGVRLSLGGAKLVAIASRDAESEPFHVLHADASEGENAIPAGHLDGGAGRWLRLIVQAESGAESALTGASAAAGAARLQRILP